MDAEAFPEVIGRALPHLMLITNVVVTSAVLAQRSVNIRIIDGGLTTINLVDHKAGSCVDYWQVPWTLLRSFHVLGVFQDL